MFLIILGLILATIGIIWLAFKLAFIITSKLIKVAIYAVEFIIIFIIWIFVFAFIC